MIGYGIDVSHFQSPDLLPWKSWTGKVDFVIARAAYGARRDESCVAHIAAARGIGAKVGVYLFFRPSESVEAQLSALHAAIVACRLDDGDIVPAIDVERDPVPSPGSDVSPAWSAPTQHLADELVRDFGNCLLYLTQREWRMMGSPNWVLHRPLWTAHYVDHEPATPGGLSATIHQHRVGPFERNGPGGSFPGDPQVDQNRLLRPLPLIGQTITDEDRAHVSQQVAAFLASEAAQLAEPFPLPEGNS